MAATESQVHGYCRNIPICIKDINSILSSHVYKVARLNYDDLVSCHPHRKFKTTPEKTEAELSVDNTHSKESAKTNYDFKETKPDGATYI
jgi:hypothetical protein